jgi:hypothetical protein
MISATITHTRVSLEGSSFTNHSKKASQMPHPASLLRQEDLEDRDSRSIEVYGFENLKAYGYTLLQSYLFRGSNFRG